MPDPHMDHFDRLASSLFASTSPFTQVGTTTPPPETPAQTPPVPLDTERIRVLVGDALGGLADNHPEEAQDALEEIIDLLDAY